MFKYQQTKSGFSLVEAIIVAALSALIFGALFSTFQYSLQLINNSRARLSALSIANDRMEYFRSLPYNDVGTVSGIPSGTIPQNSTTTLNGITFVERVLVEYVDDDADGQLLLDSNGIISDYKRIKVEYTWSINNSTSSIALVSNIVPRSVETTAGGGTVRINVIDENSALLPGASVTLINNTLVPAINITRATDASGAALFSGAPTSSDYEVSVTAYIATDQYSTDQTYRASVSNPNPIVAPFTVLEADISTLTFQIGELSDLTIKTFSNISDGSFVEDFTNITALASSTDVEAVAGELVLENVAGVYKNSGTAFMGPITPATISRWENIRVAVDLPVNTSHKVQLFTGAGAGPYTLIPNSQLPGNSVGFTDTIIDISELNSTMYPSIFVGVVMETTDTSVTPQIDEIGVYYRVSETPLASVPMTVNGNKVIGTGASSTPIYKFDSPFTTDGSGEYTFSDFEFDVYTFANTNSLDISEACSNNPFVHQAGIDSEIEVELVADSANTLRVTVVDSLGRPVAGSSINLKRPGYDVTQVAGSCGQTFFTGGPTNNNDYTIEVTATGYGNETITDFEITGDTDVTVTLSS